jgi:hypothetical protein
MIFAQCMDAGRVARHSMRALLPLLLLGPCGCVWLDAPPTTMTQSMRPAPQVEPGMIQIDAHLIQRPLGDAFLDEDIWKQTDELFLPLAAKELLNRNGIRVGQVVGMAPSKLQELARSPRWCLDPRRRVLPSGESFRQVLSPVLHDCPIELITATRRETLHFDQAKFLVEVTARTDKDQRTRLTFTPKIETGENYMPYMPSSADGGWKLSLERPTKALKELSWEMSLAPGAVVLLGGLATKDRTAGRMAFVQEGEDGAVQRLLVLRVASSHGNKPAGYTLEDMARMPSAAELAAQVGMPAVRAKDR